MSKNQRMSQRLVYNFLLKRKLAIGVYIKIVGQITSHRKSGQRDLNSIPTRNYGRYKKWTNFHEVHTKIRPVQDQNELLSTGF